MFEFIKKKKIGKNPNNNNDEDAEDKDNVELPDAEGALNAIDAALQLDEREQKRQAKAKEKAEKEALKRERESYRAGSSCGCGW